MKIESTKIQEKKLETLEEAAMTVLNELDQKDLDGIKNVFHGIGHGFDSGLGVEVDNMLRSIQGKRREIKKIAEMVKNYVSQIREDGYWGPYKKEISDGCDKILEGCEDIQSGHFHLLNQTHAEMRASMGKKI